MHDSGLILSDVLLFPQYPVEHQVIVTGHPVDDPVQCGNVGYNHYVYKKQTIMKQAAGIYKE